MAVLDATNRAAVRQTYMQQVSNLRQALNGLNKADLLAAVNAIDQWIEDNTTAFNTAIPLPARTSLTTAQKQDLFLLVLRRRVQGN
jgi:hypothetical protein